MKFTSQRILDIAGVVMFLLIIISVFYWMPPHLETGYGWLYALGLALTIRGVIFLLTFTIFFKIFPKRELFAILVGLGMVFIALFLR